MDTMDIALERVGVKNEFVESVPYVITDKKDHYQKHLYFSGLERWQL